MLSIRHRYLFVHIPRTGGNSVHTVLLPFSEDKKLVKGSQDGVERFGIRNSLAGHLTKHATLAEYRAALPVDVMSSLRTFSVVRHPYDWTVSWFFSPHRWVGRTPEWDANAFADFLEMEFRPVSHYLGAPPAPGLPWGVQRLLRFERLPEEFAAWCAEAGVPAGPLPHLNASQRRPGAEYLDRSLRERVLEKCRDLLVSGVYER